MLLLNMLFKKQMEFETCHFTANLIPSVPCSDEKNAAIKVETIDSNEKNMYIWTSWSGLGWYIFMFTHIV